ncbi:MAG: hypothetical protein NC548_48775 [Lachnospiraceae bacterium]|nr:hypothetical protein [Lachnospiraceae bacterium]
MMFKNLLTFLSSGGSTIVTADAWSQIITDVTSQFSIETIVKVMSTIVVAGIGFVFLWWGARKAYRAIMSAVRKGKTGV